MNFIRMHFKIRKKCKYKSVSEVTTSLGDYKSERDLPQKLIDTKKTGNLTRERNPRSLLTLLNLDQAKAKGKDQCWRNTAYLKLSLPVWSSPLNHSWRH